MTGQLHDDGQLVVVLAAGNAGPVRGGTDLDQQDGPVGQWWYLQHRDRVTRFIHLRWD
jgi:hypothetical protein